MSHIVVAVGCMMLATFLRYLPIRRAGQNLGVDHWYWRYYLETLQKDKRFPPVLSNYLLDVAQWYPPLFPLLTARFSDAFIERNSYRIAIGIDLVRMTLLFAALTWVGVADVKAWAVVGLLYATTPLLISYNIQLNPRGLAALFFDGMMLCLVISARSASAMPLWITAIVLGALILLTHKMTSQLMLFILAGISVITGQWRCLAMIPAAMTLAFVFSKGFYWKLLIAHWDIVSFWTRYSSLLGADMIRESPLYGIPGYQTPTRQFKPGFKNWIMRLASLAIGNYAPAVTGIVLFALWAPPSDPAWRTVVQWLLTGYVFAVLTIAVPLFRGLGFGGLYLFNLAFPACLLAGYSMQIYRPATALMALLIIANSVLLVRSVRHLGAHKGLTLPDSIIQQIKRLPEGSWITFPAQLMEHICYHTRRPVLWGGHGYGFHQLLSHVFPVIRTDIRTLMKQFHLRFVLVDDAHLSDMQRVPIGQKLHLNAGGYHVLELLTDEK